MVHLFRIRKTGALFERPEEIIERHVGAALSEVAEFGRREIQKRTPEGATGNLKSRIFGEARLQPRPIVLWGTPEVYGPVVEEGRRPGSVPPPEALRPWVERRLGVPSSESKGVAFLIARAIGRRGTPGRRVFERSAPAIRRFAEKVFELKTRNMADDLNK